MSPSSPSSASTPASKPASPSSAPPSPAATPSFWIPGIPVPQARARTVRVKGRSITYDPVPSREWKRTVAIYARQGWQGWPLVGPVSLALTFFLPRPKKAKVGPRPDRKPDLINLVRGVEDALQGIAYVDDCQVVQHSTGKFWAVTKPGVYVQVLRQS